MTLLACITLVLAGMLMLHGILTAKDPVNAFGTWTLQILMTWAVVWALQTLF